MTTPLLTGTLPGVPGDVSASVRLVFTDRAAQSRRFLEYGIQQRWYQGLDLELDTGSELSVTGFAGASTTRAGSFNTNVIRATLTTTPVVVCSTGTQNHVGSFRNALHIYATSTDVRVRLSYQVGSGPWQALEWQTPAAAAAWCEANLGVINVDPALTGTQTWTGRFEAMSSTVGDTIDIDYDLLTPCGEGYGRVAVPQTFETVSVFSARDEFDQSAGNLGGKTLPIGGTWTTAGAATDFSVSGSGTLNRATVSDGGIYGGRTAVAASVSLTNTIVQADITASVLSGAGLGLLARYVDANNFLRALIFASSSGNGSYIQVDKRVAGSGATISGSTTYVPLRAGTPMTIRLAVDAGGRWQLWVGTPASQRLFKSGYDAVLATGGALASGNPGLYDLNTTSTAQTRSYDNFAAAAGTDPSALYSGRVAQIRSDGAVRQDSSGTTYGPMPSALMGSYPKAPCAGAEARTARVVARALRNNPEDMAVPDVTDKLQVQCVLTPRYLAPR